jgi:hypothetical protein
MADYLKSTNFATKDALPSGNAGKIVKGTELDNEFNAIADAVDSKADLLNPVFSGLLTTDTLTTGGATNIGGTLAVAGALSAAADVQFTGTGRVKVPTGTTGQRPASPSTGSLRFNTTTGFLENYNGTEWRVVSPDPTPAQVSDEVNTSTGYFQIPVGNIAQRPVSPAEGLLRYNSETDIYEGYIGTQWQRFLTVNQGSYTINYVAIGGGGGGLAGGGGAGRFTASTTSAVPGTTVLSITIGAGGASATAGSASVITGIVSATGGGAGLASGGAGVVSGGTSGNGFLGGTGYVGGTGGANGGGGGSNGTGGNAGPSGGDQQGGVGGAGTETLITGTSQFLAGGGGGGAQGPGGAGTNGGGNGWGNGAGSPNAGTPNTGGGGGGYIFSGAQGGSGVIFLSMPTVNYTGTHTGSPTISTTGSNTVLKFTGSGTYTC